VVYHVAGGARIEKGGEKKGGKVILASPALSY